METRKLLWLMALIFSLVLLVQYVELPYGYVLSSLLSFGKSQVTSDDTDLVGDQFLNATKFADDELDLKSEMDNLTNDSVRISNGTSSSSDNPGATNEEDEDMIASPPLNMPSQVSSPDRAQPRKRKRKHKRRTNLKSKDPENMVVSNSKPGELTHNNPTNSVITSPPKKRWIKGPPSVVVPISAMNDMLHQSRASYVPAKPQWTSQADQELLNAKNLIQSAEIVEKSPQTDINVYRNFSTFIRSYELMEQTLKVYIYAEGKRPIFHQPELHGIYASEGWFMKQLEENKHFVTKNASEAHLFYLPFSSRVLEETLYVKDSHSRKNLVAYLSEYLQHITTTYQFWNRTFGADHFLVACHDWAPAETSRIMRNCIRALCNADVRGGLNFGKDVSLPEIFIRDPLDPLRGRGGKPPSQRHILAFFAGNMHGYLRPILLDNWRDKDPNMKIFGKLRPEKGQMTYSQYMKNSKYCISAKGYEPYTPRVMEAIFYECVPVIISDNYVPPFFETLNWESFAVFVLEKDIPNLKRILESIPKREYLKMQERVRQVQKHFLWHNKPAKHDVFHMILHSIWHTRVFQMRQW